MSFVSANFDKKLVVNLTEAALNLEFYARLAATRFEEVRMALGIACGMLKIVVAIGVAWSVRNLNLEGIHRLGVLITVAAIRLDGKIEFGDWEKLLQILVLNFDGISATGSTSFAALEVVAVVKVSFFQHRSLWVRIGIVVKFRWNKSSLRHLPFIVNRWAFCGCIVVVSDDV